MRGSRRPTTGGAKRASVVLAIAALLLVGAAADQVQAAPSAGAAPASAAHRLRPSAVPPVSAVSSSWYCSAATAATPAQADTSASGASTTSSSPPTTAPAATPAPAGKGGKAGKTAAAGATKRASKTASKPKAPATSASLLLANAGERPVQASVTTAVAGARPRQSAVTLPAHGQAVVPESLAGGHDVAASVAVEGGGVAVEQRLSTGSGASTVPCASAPSQHWYFASGSTAQGDRLLVSLYNPLATDAIVDVSFATDKGVARPGDDQGVVVPAGSQVVLDVGAHVQLRPVVATAVSVRLGRVVAYESQIGTGSRSGVALALGAPSAATAWHFPAGLVAPGTQEALDVFNPGGEPADVRIGLQLTSGQAEPLRVRVGPDAVLHLPLDKEHRIPGGVPFAAVVRSTNGVGVVAERSVLDGSPGHLQGRTATLGGHRATTWVFAAGPAPGGGASLVVEDPGRAAVHVSVSRLDGTEAVPVPGMSEVAVSPGRPTTLALGKSLIGPELSQPLVVTGTGPVVVEEDASAPGGKGVTAVLGEPAG